VMSLNYKSFSFKINNMQKRKINKSNLIFFSEI